MKTEDASVVVVVREAQPADVEAIRDMFASLHSYNQSLDSLFALADGWEAVLDAHLAFERRREVSAITWVAELGEGPAGFLMLAGHADSPLYLHRHWAEVLALFVAPAYRGLGVGSSLIAAASDWAMQRGHDRLQLHVTSSNQPARAFYAGVGFRPVQEIWRLDLPAARGRPPEDVACESAYARGEGLLGGRGHQAT